MKKSILNLGKALNRAEQRNVKGGDFYFTPETNPACIIAISFDGTTCLCKYWIPDGNGKCELDLSQVNSDQ
ncbi:hypothetical protein [uncultured Tenacibaculum sp.]|uniref:hypothetical protein n=1 Tax=uncultured Tenacibaculum sp. TaxID=174713 RepID=UPI0026055E4C|nr:hypothetical protein [uncultured Tenacibaculum sp.]